MTDLRKAAEMALTKLDHLWEIGIDAEYKVELLPEIHALRQALAQPEQEPPPWWTTVEKILEEYGLQAIDFVADFKKAMGQPEQEPVGWLNANEFVDAYAFTWRKKETHDIPLYTAPPNIEAAVLAEREACAKLLEDAAFKGTIISCTSAAAAIRARGEK